VFSNWDVSVSIVERAAWLLPDPSSCLSPIIAVDSPGRQRGKVSARDYSSNVGRTALGLHQTQS
jgi:hypothetical protein